jgi:hypothetical protein
MTKVVTRDADWHLLISKQGVEAVSSAIKVDLLNSASEQSIPRDWLPIVFKAHEEILPIIGVTNKRDFDSSDQCVDGWIALIREGLYANPSVENIFVSIEDNNVDVWVVIPKRDIAILRQLVEIEGRILEILVSGERSPFLMDFHIIYRSGRNLEELAPTRTIRLPR